MPMTFTDDMVENYLTNSEMDTSGTASKQRERLSNLFDEKGDHLAAWEVRTGRPWDDMTSIEADILLGKFPRLIRNPGLLSRLLQETQS